MDADSRYLMLYAMGDESFDVARSEETLAEFFKDHAITPMVTRKAYPYFLRRELDIGTVKPKIYRVFETHGDALSGQTALAAFRVRGPVNGRATVERAEVRPWDRRQGVASRVYDIIGDDLQKVGAELWPSAPISMSDEAFLLWWQRRPDLVVYYPHRERLNLPLTLDQHAALTKLDDIDRALMRMRLARAGASIWPQIKKAVSRWMRKVRGNKSSLT